MQEQDKVSVILPIYNAEKYLEECVDSILNQTYSNLQIILVNDGSKDNSWKICQKLKSKDSRIEIFSQKNSGVSVARNKGLDIADGKWIMFVDPDDILDIKIIQELLSKMNDQIDIVACSCYGFFDKNNKEIAHFFKGNQLFKSNNKIDLFLQLMNVSYKQSGNIFTAIGVPWGKIYRRSFIEKYKLRFDPKLRRMQDNIFNMYSFYYSRSVFYLDKPLYFYRLDHIKKYNKKNLQNIKQIYMPVIKARYECIHKLHIYNIPQIYEGYVNEAAKMFLSIINGMVITGSASSIIKKESDKLRSYPIFSLIFNNKNKLKNSKTKVGIYLISHRMFKAYAMIYKTWNYVKK